jgi:hypothetical protein
MRRQDGVRRLPVAVTFVLTLEPHACAANADDAMWLNEGGGGGGVASVVSIAGGRDAPKLFPVRRVDREVFATVHRTHV